MSSPTIEQDIFQEFDTDFYQNKLQYLYSPTQEKLKKFLRKSFIFNFLFIGIILLECLYFFVHLTFLVQTFALAIHLALIFATLFSYFTLRLYYQAYKKEKLVFFKNQFIKKCRKVLTDLDGESEYHCLTAHAAYQMASKLHDVEYGIYQFPLLLKNLSSVLEKISCRSHWMDLHCIKELLLQSCVEEYLHLVKVTPTNLEAHEGLANAYVMLSGLYADPKKFPEGEQSRWIPPQKFSEEFQNKFRSTAERAIEEFRILSDYAPNDPWVHVQLAYSYRDLQMPQEEIYEYETVLQLCPEDKDTLFKLGKLYFEQGHNAKGLQVYEALRRSNYKKAEELIDYYGAYSLDTPTHHRSH